MPLITDMCCYRCSCLQMSCKNMEGFRSRINWRNGGLGFENAVDYHLCAPVLVVEDSLLISILALFYCLLSGVSSFKKRWEMFYVSPRCRCSRACSSDYFWTAALSWQVPKRRKCPSKKKEQTGWWCGVWEEEARFVQRTARPWSATVPSGKGALAK